MAITFLINKQFLEDARTKNCFVGVPIFLTNVKIIVIAAILFRLRSLRTLRILAKTFQGKKQMVVRELTLIQMYLYVHRVEE